MTKRVTKRVTKRLEVYLEKGRKAPCGLDIFIVLLRTVWWILVCMQATTDLLDIEQW